MDKFYEQMTSAYKGRLYSTYSFLMIAMALIFVMTITTAVFPVGIIAAGLAVFFYFSKRKEYVEYEYTFTSGEVDIDVIMEAKKRKDLINFDVNNIEIMAPLGSSYLDGQHKGKKIIAYPKNSKDTVFVVIVNKKNVVNEIHFIPDEELLTLCFRTNPKNVKKKDI